MVGLVRKWLDLLIIKVGLWIKVNAFEKFCVGIYSSCTKF